jgi:hypothetical protein
VEVLEVERLCVRKNRLKKMLRKRLPRQLLQGPLLVLDRLVDLVVVDQCEVTETIEIEIEVIGRIVVIEEIVETEETEEIAAFVVEGHPHHEEIGN